MNSNLLKVAMCLMLVGGAVNIQNVESMDQKEQDDSEERIEVNQIKFSLDEPQQNKDNININENNNNFDFLALQKQIDELAKDFNNMNETMSNQTNMEDMINIEKINAMQNLKPNLKDVKFSFEDQIRRQYGLAPVAKGDPNQQDYYLNYFQTFDEKPGALSLQDLQDGYNNFIAEYNSALSTDNEHKTKQIDDKRELDELQKNIAQLRTKMMQSGFIFDQNGQLVPNQDLKQIAELSFFKKFNYRYKNKGADPDQQEKYNEILDNLFEMQKQMQQYNNQLVMTTTKLQMSMNLYKSSHASTKKSKELLYNILRELQAKGKPTYDDLNYNVTNYYTRKQICQNHLNDVNRQLQAVQKSLENENKKFQATDLKFEKELAQYKKGEQNDMKRLEVKSDRAKNKLQHAKTRQELKKQEDTLSQEVDILQAIMQNEYEPIDQIVNDKSGKKAQYIQIYNTISNLLDQHTKNEALRKKYNMQKQLQTNKKNMNKKSSQLNDNKNKEQIEESIINIQKDQFISNNNKVSSNFQTLPQAGFNITHHSVMTEREDSKEHGLNFNTNVLRQNFPNNNTSQSVLSNINNMDQDNIATSIPLPNKKTDNDGMDRTVDAIMEEEYNGE